MDPWSSLAFRDASQPLVVTRRQIVAFTNASDGQSMYAPPLTEMASPVRNAASSDTRNATTLATSSADSSRANGVAATYDARTASGSVARSSASHKSSRDCMDVATNPGQTQLTRMPCGAS